MRYSNKIFTLLSLKLFTLLSLYLFTSLSVLADDIVITRKASPGKALLDRKFIFMQGGSSFKKDSQSTARGSTVKGQRIPALIPVHRSPITVHHSTPNIKPAADNWDAYAEEVPIELEESLSVGARLLN